MRVRELNRNEWEQVAMMIHASTNAWYQSNLNRLIFDENDSSGCLIFPEVYEALDPHCCLVAEAEDGSMMGSCFYHPRETHVSLGIMNAHPDHAGRGVAATLLAEVVRRAGNLPVRLVSSCMNLDSFSLYTRAGFTPGELYQDMYIPSGKVLPETPEGGERVREASAEDVEAMVELEEEVSGIRRTKDFQFFIRNDQKIWKTLVLEGPNKSIEGFLGSVSHPGSTMLGPGVMRSETAALALIHAQLVGMGGHQPVFLVPARSTNLVSSLYQWGARNCELHVAQARGVVTPPSGITMPTFMPETS